MDQARAERLYAKAAADHWRLPPEVFTAALERSAAKAFAGRAPSEADLDRYFGSLQLGDLALACACAAGHEPAWDYFMAEYRPALYRAADAIDPSGGAREVADALHAELYGLKEREGVRRSLFEYFHGRSSLATWLRSLVSQRHVDRIRQTRRLDPLPEEASAAALPTRERPLDPDRQRFAAAMQTVLAAAIAALDPRERLRLGGYYAEGMTLAQIGRLTREHEATVSRQLARTRRAIRQDVEQRLSSDYRFSEAEIDECFASIVDDAGTLDMGEWLGRRKNAAADRSTSEDVS